MEGLSQNVNFFGHIANHSTMLDFLKDGIEVLLTFKGVQGYVFFRLIKNINTWDYSAVYVQAHLKMQTPSELEEILKQLVYRFEKDQENSLFL